MIQHLRDTIVDYVAQHPELSYKDFSEAAVVIAREARQLPDANNLQKRYSFKLSPLGPNPNGQHTVNAKKQTVSQAQPNNGY